MRKTEQGFRLTFSVGRLGPSEIESTKKCKTLHPCSVFLNALPVTTLAS